ncbi:hypothetical protein [Miltoncostaea marina]|uniref:hypothetical protein n=1 Tax=Miltoncostaea marina TaxID=2843215 RepID=UPI001C3E1171|nr:hypothetical protein [Miltoncostaea marina]
MLEGRHADLLTEAVALDAEGFRAMFDGRRDDARAALRAAAGRYRESWEAAPPRSYGRLVGMLKSAVLAGEGAAAAAYARGALGDGCDSPTSCYALAVAALAQGDDAAAAAAAAGMREGGEAFARTADAITHLASRDAPRYALALAEVVAGFEARDAHLTGVPVADTAMMLEVLAEERGMAARPASPLMPGGAAGR